MKDENGFNEFWALWPRRQKKLDAKKAYQGAIKIVQHDEIMTGVRSFLEHLEKEKTERKFIPLPASWLRAGSWEDEYERPLSQRLQQLPGDVKEAKRFRLQADIRMMEAKEARYGYSLASEKAEKQAELDAIKL